MRRMLAAGNWKMNGLSAALGEIAALPTPENCDVLICPPATLISDMAALGHIQVGGQDCHVAVSGAHTGDVSAEMIADAGGSAVIVGHSERRADHGESDALIRTKAEAAWRAGLTAIICLGESLEERQAGQTLERCIAQLDGSVPDGATGANTVIAYEPIWAIGTGLTADAAQIAEVHNALRARLDARFGEEGDKMRILYGGSVKPGNAVEIFSIDNVDGGLVGGASLKGADFSAIIDAAAQCGS